MAGSNNYQVEIKEMVVKKIQADSRAGRQKVLRVMAGEDESPISNEKKNKILSTIKSLYSTQFH